MSTDILPASGAAARKRRSTQTMILGGIAMLLVLWLLAIPLSWAPEPIGNNAQLFAEGTRVTVLLTLVAGVAGIVMGVLAIVTLFVMMQLTGRVRWHDVLSFGAKAPAPPPTFASPAS